MSDPKHCYFCKHRNPHADHPDLTKKPCSACKNWSKFVRRKS